MIQRILLINNPRVTPENMDVNLIREIYPPLGLMALSAMVKRELPEIRVEILDLHYETIRAAHEGRRMDWQACCAERIARFQPQMVGISIIFGHSFPHARTVCQGIRRDHPEILLVGGGVHVTAIADRPQELEFLDFVALYEAEYHFIDLLRYLNGQQETVRGVLALHPEKVRDPAHFLPVTRRPERLDDLPIPDFGALELASYHRYGILSAAQTVAPGTPFATINTSRGCVADCQFCSTRFFNGPVIRTQSPERVLAEIDLLHTRYGIRHIDIVDDDFTVSKKRVMAIADGLIQRGYPLTWSIGNGIRIGSLDAPLLEKMAAAGCTYFSLGIESGDAEVLKAMKKPLTLELLRRKAELLHRFPQIYYRANFIVGFPGETMEQMERTMVVAREIGLDWSLFSLLTPLPNTPMLRSYLASGAGFSSESIDYSFSSAQGILSQTRDEAFIMNYVYDQNLCINFRDNVNLKGRHVTRAVVDFERVTQIAGEHAFAWNGLVEGYGKLGRLEEARQAQARTRRILETNPYWRDKFTQLACKVNEV